jgi:hypothetical protein
MAKPRRGSEYHALLFKKDLKNLSKCRKVHPFLRTGSSKGIVKGHLCQKEEKSMIFGMTPFTFFHVLLSLIGILSGFIAVFGMIAGKRLDGWTALFVVTTALTSITGFFFPFHGLTPGIILGIISLVVLAFAIPARYLFHLAGAWRKVYVVTASLALYLNVFVLVAQLFGKVPSLHALAPTGSEPPFLISEIVVMAVFIVLTVAAAIKFRPEPLHA